MWKKETLAKMTETVANDLEALLEHFPNAEWDWWAISSNPNITFDYVKLYPEKPWDWYGLGSNPNKGTAGSVNEKARRAFSLRSI